MTTIDRRCDAGRCSLEQKKHTDTSKVIWIATSNLGQKIISEHVKEWGHPDTPPARGEYTQLATAIRRHIAEILGVCNLLSRVLIMCSPQLSLSRHLYCHV